MSTNLIWVDLETTQLEPGEGAILELGIAVTTPELEVTNQRSWIFGFSKSDLGAVSDWSLKQHFFSGLLPLNLTSENSIGEIQDDALRALGNWTQHVGRGQHAMCGSTVHFDRQWLKVHLPQLEAWFHYRNIDVSTIKNLARLWALDLAEFKGRALHRVKEDIEDSINELRYYVDNGIIVGPGIPGQVLLNMASTA